MKRATIGLYWILIVLVATFVVGAPAMAAGLPTIYWQNQASGDITLWQMSGAIINNYAFLYTHSDPNWKLAATADLFQNNDTDLIWENTATGDVVYWGLDGDTSDNTGVTDTIADTDWQIVGVN